MTPITTKPIPPATVQHVLPPNLDHEYFKDGAQHPFRPDATGFEAVNAWWLAEAALLTYAPAEFAIPQFRAGGWTVDTDQPLTGRSTLCYVVYSRDAVVVAFRGTRVIKPGTPPTLEAMRGVLADIWTDGRVKLIDLGQGEGIHCGFHDALDQVWTPKVAPCLARLKAENPARSVWFTGHSLGAALATLAAMRFGDAQGVYTFGSPLVGDRTFAGRYTAPTFRIVNNNDIVPHVPRVGTCPTAPFIRTYEHVGQLKYIASTGAMHDNPSFWSQIADGVAGRHRHLLGMTDQLRTGWLDELPDEGFNDHAPLFYALHVWNAYATRA